MEPHFSCLQILRFNKNYHIPKVNANKDTECLNDTFYSDII